MINLLFYQPNWRIGETEHQSVTNTSTSLSLFGLSAIMLRASYFASLLSRSAIILKGPSDETVRYAGLKKRRPRGCGGSHVISRWAKAWQQLCHPSPHGPWCTYLLHTRGRKSTALWLASWPEPGREKAAQLEASKLISRRMAACSSTPSPGWPSHVIGLAHRRSLLETNASGRHMEGSHHRHEPRYG